MRAPSLLLLLLVLPRLVGAEPLSISVTPSRVVLGQDAAVRVQVMLPPGTPPLRAAASSGQLQPLPDSPPGVAEYQWTPPDIHYPQLAVLAFWTQASEGPPEVTPVFIPLLGHTTLKVATNKAGAEVTVQVADTTFGPVRTDRKGRAQVPVDVPPGVREAQVIVTQKRQQTRSTTGFGVPPPAPLLALIGSESIPAGGSGWLVVFGERQLPGPELGLRVRGGAVEEPSPGVFRLTPEPGAREVRVDVQRWDGTGAAQVAASVEAPLALVVPLPQLALLRQQTPPVPVKPSVNVRPPPPKPETPSRVSFVLRAGGSFSGGDNRGPLASLGVGVRLPPLGGRLWLEAETGARQASTHPRVEPLGPLNARVVAVPLLVAVGLRAFELGPLSVWGRLGAGGLYYDHRATSSFLVRPLFELGWAPMGFLAGEVSWSFGAVSALLELRGSYAPARSTLIDAQLGGLSASLGVRYVL